jgi:hypothetical protein
VHDVSKCTIPSFSTSDCAKPGRAGAISAAAVNVINAAADIFFMVLILFDDRCALCASMSGSTPYFYERDGPKS